jgi:hypothetical protein
VAAGADPHLIETRVTHTKKSRSAFAGYHGATLNRGPEWARICAEVTKLKISRRPQGHREVIALPVAAGAEGAELTKDDGSRYSGRYSPAKDRGSHAKKFGRSAAQLRATEGWSRLARSPLTFARGRSGETRSVRAPMSPVRAGGVIGGATDVAGQVLRM